MKPCNKYRIIYHYKDKYTIMVMCKFFKVSRSGYYDWQKGIDNPDKYECIAKVIRQCQKQINRLIDIAVLNFGYCVKQGL